eukprot:TRINITY_DN16375_c0_g1_i2.p1 TRINITY_DN16375_c0_g1~~TRINITY_DN16375_c0_g1_i2.p1  ORF type:complete len:427 (+),score=48.65 TRINITY_DN16375_c0_g1_i2:83-1363(+)
MRCLRCALAVAILSGALCTLAPTPPSSLHLVNITADIFILQYHFQLHGEESLDDWIWQLTNYAENYGAKALPKTLLWRIAPPALRDDPNTNFPTLQENLDAIQSLRQLYARAGAHAPRFVYYPDIETDYADLWATSTAEQEAIHRDPTSAVSKYLPKDIQRWHKQGHVFDEILLEQFAAPLTPPATGTLVSPTMIKLRESHVISKCGLSLTPDFSVLGGRCRRNVADDCALLVGNRSGESKYPAGAFYTQTYNIYTSNTGSNTTLTDVTPWSPASKAQECGVITDPTNCKSSCCVWVGDDNRCVPVTWEGNSSLHYCLIPAKGLCGGDQYTGCNPEVGGSIYTARYTAAQAATRVATIFSERILSRCHPGGGEIESLDLHTFWKAFPAIFSYEPWSAPGPPLYLMGNPTYTYTLSLIHISEPTRPY